MPNKPKHHHSDRDRIFTPELIAKKLIGEIPSENNDSWCDPCYGEGIFYNNFPTQNKDYYEIDLNRDFLKCTKKYDWCVTNIPFSKPKEFIFKMADSSLKGFGILCLSNSMTATRLMRLRENNFFVHKIITLYVKSWGFGYKTDFYIFTRQENPYFGLEIF